jgi:hypothetical protein
MIKVDGLTEELRGVARAMIELEDAWAVLALKKTAAVVRATEQRLRQPESGRDGGGDGARGRRGRRDWAMSDEEILRGALLSAYPKQVRHVG